MTTRVPIRNIIIVLEDNGDEIQGTDALAMAISTLNCKSYVLRSARLAELRGEITIIPSSGGRGRKTIYKRNRNQPGLPRKR
jgi:hypothetical protein